MSWEKVSKIIGVVTGIMVILGAVLGFINYFAKNTEFQQFKTDTKIIQLEQQQIQVQQKVWDYADRLKKEVNPQIKEELEKRKRELEFANEKLEKRLKEVKP